LGKSENDMGRFLAVAVGSFILVAPKAFAHHSGAAFFDQDQRVEIAGVVSEMKWRNPHVSFKVTATNDDGQQEEWTVESNAVNLLERQGVSPDTVEVGDDVRFWGPPARRGEKSMRAYNVLLPDGTEVVLIPRSPPERRWDDHELVASVPELENKDVSESIAQADGIYRVWSRGRIKTLNSKLPLTEAALAAKETYDPFTDDPVLQCIPTGMPGVMDVSFPIEFSKQGKDIVLHLEQWDTVRTIHMDGDLSAAANMPATREGYSAGHWAGDTLVVETTNIKTDYFDDSGTPISDAVHVVERWTVNEGESGLHWQATTTDPNTFTEPVLQEQTFPWVPGEEIKPYGCVAASQ
jgi:hypothetical protein